MEYCRYCLPKNEGDAIIEYGDKDFNILVYVSDFKPQPAIAVRCDDNELSRYVFEYEPINYCPMCGRKLKQE